MVRRVPLAGLLAAGVWLSVFGCAPTSKPVFVDLAAVPQVAPQKKDVTIPSSAIHGLSTAKVTKFSIPALPEVKEGRLVSLTSEKIKGLIEQNRARTLRTIIERLHEASLRRADQLRREETAAFEPTRRKLIQAALDAISKQYLQYADKKGPKVAQLAVVAGFPDPDPLGKRPPRSTDGMGQLVFNIAQRLRAENGILDAKFKSYREVALKSADSSADAALTALLAKIEAQMNAADSESRRLAEEEVKRTQADLGPLLVDSPPATLPATPGASIRIEPSPPNAPNPGSAPSQPSGAGMGASSDDIQNELTIWEATHGYHLVSKGKGRDATQEFIQWRKTFKAAG